MPPDRAAVRLFELGAGRAHGRPHLACSAIRKAANSGGAVGDGTAFWLSNCFFSSADVSTQTVDRRSLSRMSAGVTGGRDEPIPVVGVDGGHHCAADATRNRRRGDRVTQLSDCCCTCSRRLMAHCCRERMRPHVRSWRKRTPHRGRILSVYRPQPAWSAHARGPQAAPSSSPRRRTLWSVASSEPSKL